jgi:hypothetical protein
MSSPVYTKAVQLALFVEVVKIFGSWSSSIWVAGKPKFISTKDFNAKCEKIRVVLEKNLQDKAPKTARSIAMAIYFTIDTVTIKPNTHSFRSAAYEAGFMRLKDILELEGLTAPELEKFHMLG